MTLGNKAQGLGGKRGKRSGRTARLATVPTIPSNKTDKKGGKKMSKGGAACSVWGKRRRKKGRPGGAPFLGASFLVENPLFVPFNLPDGSKRKGKGKKRGGEKGERGTLEILVPYVTGPWHEKKKRGKPGKIASSSYKRGGKRKKKKNLFFSNGLLKKGEGGRGGRGKFQVAAPS